MPNVRVKDIPVRYENVTYQPGEEFDMKAEHVVDSLVTIVEAKKVEKKTPKK